MREWTEVRQREREGGAGGEARLSLFSVFFKDFRRAACTWCSLDRLLYFVILTFLLCMSMLQKNLCWNPTFCKATSVSLWDQCLRFIAIWLVLLCKLCSGKPAQPPFTQPSITCLPHKQELLLFPLCVCLQGWGYGFFLRKLSELSDIQSNIQLNTLLLQIYESWSYIIHRPKSGRWVL